LSKNTGSGLNQSGSTTLIYGSVIPIPALTADIKAKQFYFVKTSPLKLLDVNEIVSRDDG
jgi:hypothetical protein